MNMSRPAISSPNEYESSSYLYPNEYESSSYPNEYESSIYL